MGQPLVIGVGRIWKRSGPIDPFLFFCFRFRCLFFFVDFGNSDDLFVRIDSHDDDAGGASADERDVGGRYTDGLALVGDEADIHIFGDKFCSNQRSGLFGGLIAGDSFAAAAMSAELVHGSPFAVAFFGDGQKVGAMGKNLHGDDFVAFLFEAHAGDAHGGAAGFPDILFVEADGQAVTAYHHDFFISVRKFDFDEFVSLF